MEMGEEIAVGVIRDDRPPGSGAGRAGPLRLVRWLQGVRCRR